MRRLWWTVGLLALGLGMGCMRDRRPEFPKPKDEKVAPPEGAYSGPVSYPREMLNQFPIKEEKKDGLPRAPQGPGMGAMNRGM